MTPVVSTSWAASKVLLAVPGTFFGAACTIAAAGTYYLIVLDAATAPVNSDDVTAGAHGKVLRIVPITTSGADEIVNIKDDLAGYSSDSGIRCETGCVVVLSSTAPTSITLVASGLWVNGSVG